MAILENQSTTTKMVVNSRAEGKSVTKSMKDLTVPAERT